MTAPTLSERLRARVLVKHGGPSGIEYGWNLTEADSLLHAEAAAEIERLEGELRAALETTLLRDQIDELLAQVSNLSAAVNAKQAKIDRLMQEFCPGEMTASQREEWERNQVPARGFIGDR